MLTTMFQPKVLVISLVIQGNPASLVSAEMSRALNMPKYTLQWAIVNTPYYQDLYPYPSSRRTLVLLLYMNTLQVSQFGNDAKKLCFNELNDASSMPHPDQITPSISYTTWQQIVQLVCHSIISPYLQESVNE